MFMQRQRDAADHRVDFREKPEQVLDFKGTFLQ